MTPTATTPSATGMMGMVIPGSFRGVVPGRSWGACCVGSGKHVPGGAFKGQPCPRDGRNQAGAEKTLDRMPPCSQIMRGVS